VAALHQVRGGSGALRILADCGGATGAKWTRGDRSDQPICRRLACSLL